MYLLGYDVGSSSVKASLVSVETGKCVATAFYPKSEARWETPFSRSSRATRYGIWVIFL